MNSAPHRLTAMELYLCPLSVVVSHGEDVCFHFGPLGSVQSFQGIRRRTPKIIEMVETNCKITREEGEREGLGD
jgi:hypothetical protein